MDSPDPAAVKAHAAACAAHLPSATGTFAADLPGFADAFRELTAAVTRIDPRYMFDREGRPSAVAAIRAVLPSVERELLDAVVEDFAAELAATQQAIYQIALALVPRTSP